MRYPKEKLSTACNITGSGYGSALRALGQDDTVRYEKYLRKSLELGD